MYVNFAANMTTLRYMGTKRSLGPLVKDAIKSCASKGRVADLFSGMGAIAQILSPRRSVVLNDVMAFPTIFARANCLENTKRTPAQLLATIYPLFQYHRRMLRRDFAERLEKEAEATKNCQALRRWLTTAEHVANSPRFESLAKSSKLASSYRAHRLTTLYFSAGYFSTSQAIDLDALRFAIDHSNISKKSASAVLAVWLSTASKLINSPGHSAQYLKPNSAEGFRRLNRLMQRNVWEEFTTVAHQFNPWGSTRWRKGNSVYQRDALNLVDNGLPSDVGVVYADPPYTRDQYTRFYHLFETLLLYDYPASIGEGRYRNGRYVSPFCRLSDVADAFDRLFDGAKSLGVPLVLSYPSDGMLQQAGIDVEEFVRDSFARVDVRSFANTHSTLGASKGAAKKTTYEYIFVCK